MASLGLKIFTHRFSVSVFLVFHCPILSLTCYKINEKKSSATESLLKNPECLIYIIERLLFVYVALICGLVLFYPYRFTLVKWCEARTSFMKQHAHKYEHTLLVGQINTTAKTTQNEHLISTVTVVYCKLLKYNFISMTYAL